jgi:hypothetical protein
MTNVITKEEITRKLDQLPPESLAEVAQFIDFLEYCNSHLAAPAPSSAPREHPAFGIWADRTDISDSV